MPNTGVQRENRLNAHRSSLLTSNKQLPQIPTTKTYQAQPYMSRSFEDDVYPTTEIPRNRRKLHSQKRSNSRQSSIETTYDDGGYRTPELQSRGASLPATPLTTPKFGGKLPTGRQLPQPNHRSANNRRQRSIKRTSSAEYTEQNDNFYTRPGAVSAAMYNEDYNYAYQSTDNLPEPAFHQIAQPIQQPVIAMQAAVQLPSVQPVVPLKVQQQMDVLDTYSSGQKCNSERRTSVIENTRTLPTVRKQLPTYEFDPFVAPKMNDDYFNDYPRNKKLLGR